MVNGFLLSKIAENVERKKQLALIRGVEFSRLTLTVIIFFTKFHFM